MNDDFLKLKNELIDLYNEKQNLNGFISYCNAKVELNNKIKKLTSFIDLMTSKKIPLSERTYCIINDIYNPELIPKCACGNKKSFKSFTIGYNLSCGKRSCYQSLPEVTEKKHKTAIENFGSLKEAYHETSLKTIKERYNTDNVSKLDSIKEKKRKTSIRNYNTNFPWQSEKGKEEQKQGVINKYGVENISQVESIKLKKEETSLKNWGFRNPSQSKIIRKKILEKNGTLFTFPSGKQCLIDGEENVVLDYLCKIYDEEKLIPQPEIEILYYMNDKKYVWFPDLLIKDVIKNKIIEIKDLNFIFSCVDNIKDKIQGGLNAGYDSFMILTYKESLFSFYLTNYDKNEWAIKTIVDNNNDILNDVISKLENKDFNLKRIVYD